MLDTQAFLMSFWVCVSFISILHWRSQRALYATKGKRGKNLLHGHHGDIYIFNILRSSLVETEATRNDTRPGVICAIHLDRLVKVVGFGGFPHLPPLAHPHGDPEAMRLLN